MAVLHSFMQVGTPTVYRLPGAKMIYRRIARPLLFTQDAENAHEHTLEMLSGISHLALPPGRDVFTHTRLQVEVAGAGVSQPGWTRGGV